MTPESQVAVLAPQPPALRGLFHLGAAFAAMAGTAWLMLLADSPTAYVGGAVFGASLILLYWTSAGYHRIAWTPMLRRLARRLDHSMIFVLIAGTYTPLCLEVSLAWGIPVLAVVWSVAGVGALMKVVWLDAPKWLSVSLYLALGWVGVVAASEVLAQFSAGPIAMIMLGGLLGILLPFMFRRLGIDPAIASGPLVTTLNDLVSVTFYMFVAMLIAP